MIRWPILLAAVLLGCESPTTPFPASELSAFVPPAHYAAWWRQVESCAGRRGALNAVRWYRMPSGSVTVDGRSASGYWWSDGNRIAVVDPTDARTVRHEMLHALLRSGDHRSDVFVERCGGVVQYVPDDAPGLLADPVSTMSEARDVLDIAFDVEPAVPSRSQGNGYFAVVVRATNRTARPVRVRLPFGVTASYRFEPHGYDAAPAVGMAISFAPGQTRRVLLDAFAPHADSVPLRVSFGNAVLPTRPVMIAP